MRKEILENMINSKRNNIINGIMSTGKTTNIGFGLVKKIIDKKESLFILDTKEEYITRYYDTFKENNYNILIINTKNPMKSNSWNPLKYSSDLFMKGNVDESIKYLDTLSEEIFYDNSAMDPFWTNMASNFFEGITLMLYKDANEEEINLRSIDSLIADSEQDMNYLQEYFRTMDKNSPAYICGSSTIFSPQETRGGIVSTALSKLNNLVCKDNLNYLLNNTDYEYKDILDKKTVIFFIANEMDACSSLVTIYIKELFNILCDNNNNKNFNYILDNFDYIDNIINFKNMLSIAISNNIKFHIFTRDKDKLERYYTNYIYKVSNAIEINDDEIIINIGGKANSIKNQSVNNEYISNIEYPKNNKKEIKLFNIKKFIIDNIKIEQKEYKDYKIEKSNLDKYVELKGNNDNPQKKAIEDKEAIFYIIKKDDEIKDSFVIFNEENWLAIDNKKLMDINYTNFIFDNLVDYDYVTLYIAIESEYIINTLKFNYDIISIEDEKQGDYLYKKIKISI